VIVLGALCTAGAFAIATGAVLGDSLEVDAGGAPTAIDHPTGAAVAWTVASAVFFFLLLLALLAWLIGQLFGYRRASGERRLQLKWLLSGAAIFVICAIVNEIFSTNQSDAWQAVGTIVSLGEIALPLSIGVAILKFRLYEIDRLISRTVSYAIVTGLLVGVFATVVTLSTNVLPFSSPVGVAASTLAAAALFNPCGGGCSTRSTAASTALVTTPRRRSPTSPSVCSTRSTSTPCEASFCGRSANRSSLRGCRSGRCRRAQARASDIVGGTTCSGPEPTTRGER